MATLIAADILIALGQSFLYWLEALWLGVGHLVQLWSEGNSEGSSTSGTAQPLGKQQHLSASLREPRPALATLLRRWARRSRRSTFLPPHTSPIDLMDFVGYAVRIAKIRDRGATGRYTPVVIDNNKATVG